MILSYFRYSLTVFAAVFLLFFGLSVQAQTTQKCATSDMAAGTMYICIYDDQIVPANPKLLVGGMVVFRNESSKSMQIRFGRGGMNKPLPGRVEYTAGPYPNPTTINYTNTATGKGGSIQILDKATFQKLNATFKVIASGQQPVIAKSSIYEKPAATLTVSRDTNVTFSWSFSEATSCDAHASPLKGEQPLYEELDKGNAWNSSGSTWKAKDSTTTPIYHSALYRIDCTRKKGAINYGIPYGTQDIIIKTLKEPSSLLLMTLPLFSQVEINAGSEGVTLGRFDLSTFYSAEDIELRRLQYRINNSMGVAGNLKGSFKIIISEAEGSPITIYTIAGSAIKYGSMNDASLTTFPMLRKNRTYTIVFVGDISPNVPHGSTYSTSLDITQVYRKSSKDTVDPLIEPVNSKSLTVR